MNMNETTQNDFHDTLLLPGNYMICLFLLDSIWYNYLESTISALVVGDGITETSVEISSELKYRIGYDYNDCLFVLF